VHIVLVATTYPAPSRLAAEPSYTSIARELARRGDSVTVVAGHGDGSPERETIDGVDVVRSLRPQVGDDLKVTSVASQCRALRSALRGHDDAVLLFADATGLPPALLGVSPETRRCVDLCVDWALTGYAASHPWWGWSGAAGGMARVSAKALGAVIERPDARNSQFLSWKKSRWEELLVRGVPVASAHVLSPGIDTSLFSYRPEPIADGDVRLQYQGPLRRDGGVNAIFLAMNSLPSRVRLRIVAESMEESYLAELAELGRAAGVTDRVEVVPAPGEAQRLSLLRSAAVFIQSSESVEAFPRYALEAASAGIPVVAAQPESGDDTGPWEEGSALRFPTGNPRALAELVATCLGEPDAVARLTRDARRLVERRFGTVHTVDQLERHLRAQL
jgi:glycosyltransferase involved in cell wall biosynthesis